MREALYFPHYNKKFVWNVAGGPVGAAGFLYSEDPFALNLDAL